MTRVTHPADALEALRARFAPLRQVAWDRLNIEAVADELERAGLLGRLLDDETTMSPDLARALVEFGKDLDDAHRAYEEEVEELTTRQSA